MTPDDVIRMAREADCIDPQHYGSMWADKLQRFAALVEDATKRSIDDDITKLAGHRTVPPWVMKLVQDAVAAERENCQDCEYHKQRAVLWRHEAYRLGGTPLPWDADEAKSGGRND